MVGQENWKYERLSIKDNNKPENYGLCIKKPINLSYLSFHILFIIVIDKLNIYFAKIDINNQIYKIRAQKHIRKNKKSKRIS